METHKEIHNVMEDWVVGEVNSICDALEKEKTDTSICTCDQCRLDAICYVLNRVAPYYMLSHRGASRLDEESLSAQQNRLDRTTLIYEALRRVSHNQRPYILHDATRHGKAAGDGHTPLFNIPAIMGRVYNGLNFSPVSGSTVELFHEGALVNMKDTNWQNPYILVPDTTGTFTFWPAPEAAGKTGVQNVFRYTIKISGGQFEELSHSFSIPVQSEEGSFPFSIARTFKLADFYLFPPGEEKNQCFIKD